MLPVLQLVIGVTVMLPVIKLVVMVNVMELVLLPAVITDPDGTVHVYPLAFVTGEIE